MKNMDKPSLYIPGKLEFLGKGWNGLLNPLNDFYQGNHLYLFAYPRNIKEKFGALRISIDKYNYADFILKNKIDNGIDNLEINEELFEDWGKYESSFYRLPGDFSTIGKEIVERVSDVEIKHFLHFTEKFKNSNDNSTADKDFIKKIITNAINEFSMPDEHIQDYGYLIHKLNLFTSSSEAMSHNICMNCSKLGSVKNHKPGSMFISCKCNDCSGVEASGGSVEPGRIEESSINQLSVYDFEVINAFSFYQEHTALAQEILKTPIEELENLLTSDEYMENKKFSAHKFEALTYLTEMINFIEFKQKHLNSQKKINPFIILSFFTREMNIPGLLTPTGSPAKFLQAWGDMRLEEKIDKDTVLAFLKEFYARPVVSSMMMREMCRSELESLIMYIEAINQKDDLSQAIYEMQSLPNVKNKI